MRTSTGEQTLSGGLLEDRSLDFIQVVDIGRLQTEVITLRVNTLVGLTGIGPRGSNETSKTTLLAAIGVPTGLPTWRLDSGQTGQYVADLLFDPPNVDPEDHVRADHGFIIAVFGRPRHTLAGDRDNLTVWVRVRRSSPYLQFRVVDRVRVVNGESHIERITAAQATWDELPARPTFGPKEYVRDVLGGIPRSTGYVSELGDMPIRHGGLLTTPLKSLTPRDIGDELVNLSGLRPRVERERERRAAAHRLKEEVEQAKNDLCTFSDRVNAELDSIEQRQEAATLVASAASLRAAQVAAQVRDILERRHDLAAEHREVREGPEAARLRGQVEEAEALVARLRDIDTLNEELDAAKTRLNELAPDAETVSGTIETLGVSLAAVRQRLEEDQRLADADRHSGRQLDDIRNELRTARKERRGADAEVLRATEDAERAHEHLGRVEAGTGAGPAAETLTAAGVDCHVIGDAVEPTPDGAGFWDAALAPWREAVAVHDVEAAISACEDLPGTLLVEGDAGDDALPDGIAGAPPVCRPLLRELAATSADRSDGHAHLRAVHTIVVGGWPQPQQGHDARIAAARAHVVQLDEELLEASRAAEAADETVGDLESELQAAEAHTRRRELRSRQDELSRELVDVRRDNRDLLNDHSAAEREVHDLERQLEDREERLEEAESSLTNAREAYGAKVTTRLEKLIDEAQRQRLGWWAARLVRAVADDRSREPTINLDAISRDDDLDALELPEDVTEALRNAVGAVLEPQTATGRSLKVESLARTAREHLEDATRNIGVLARTGDDGRITVTASEDTPRRVIDAVRQRAEAESSTLRAVETFDHLVTVLTEYLGPLLERDAEREAHLRRQLGDKEDEVEAKRDAWRRAEVGAQSLQSSLEKLASTRFAKVRKEFVRQVAADSGDDADLEVAVELPGEDDVTREMRWQVTPRWARQAGGKPVDYQRAANFAQYKVKAIQLVLAALAADDHPAGRLLLLDEVSAGLDHENREVVLRALADVADRDQVTVLATVQDDLLPVIAPHVGQLLVLRYPDRTLTYNDPTRMLSSGPDGRLVGLEETIREGRSFGFGPDTEVFADVVRRNTGSSASVDGEGLR